ncbi:universal stress protein [Flectobacillus major]|jgi:nucleotide-binding universal stress UspA family protein|uniref:universal stress protein n=1 Tax=Flectobacillus major TaxID=103 RepID=UPI0003FFD1FD|nr:universal stress protein [Flectobacillus major]
MKKILVPTDFSELSLAALDIAAMFARATAAEIVLYHKDYISLPYIDYVETPITTFDVEAIEEQHNQTQKRLGQIINSPKYEGLTIVTYNTDDFEELGASIAERTDIDLIVMGSEGASGWKEFLDGSNSESVVRHAHCPVLVIKSPISSFYPRKVLIAVDFETPFDDKVLSLLNKEVEQKYIVYVNASDDFEDTRSIKKKMRAFEQEHNITDHEFVIYNDFSVSNGIIHCAEDLQVDLIVMSTKARSGISHFLFGSVTETVLNHSDIPILATIAHH